MAARCDAVRSQNCPPLVVLADLWYLFPFLLLAVFTYFRLETLMIAHCFVWLLLAASRKVSIWGEEAVNSIFLCHCTRHSYLELEDDEPTSSRFVVISLIAPTGFAIIGAWNSFHGDDIAQSIILALISLVLLVGLIRESALVPLNKGWNRSSFGAAILFTPLAVAYGIMLQATAKHLGI